MTAISLLKLTGRRATPLIQQAEGTECGLACLAMVADYHGLKTDMPALRRRFGLSLKGTTLKALMDIAEKVGFHARPLRSDIDGLAQIPLPVILHWNMNHFVVLVKMTRRLRGSRYQIHDPARGVRTLREDEFSRHFTGVALELTPSEKFRPGNVASKLRISQLWSKLTGLWSTLGSILLLSVVLQVVALATPFYLQLAVDTAFPSFDTDLLLMLAIGFGGLAVINMMTGWLRSLILVSLGSALSYQIVTNLSRHMLRLPLPWFEKRHVGDIISRFGSTQAISQLLSQGLAAAVIDGMMAFLTLALMFVYSPLLGSIALVAWLLFAGLKIGFLHALRMRNIDAITAAARENSAFIESVRGIAAVKAFGQEGNRQRTWQQLKAEAVNAQIRLGRLTAGFDALGQFILAVEKVLFVFLAVRMAMDGAFTVGMIFAFQAYKQQFLDAATRLVEQAINYKLLDVHLNRIADIALSQPEGGDTERSQGTESFKGAIELRNVAFRYGASEPEVLRSVNLRIEIGEMVALIGPSGGGKTTLLKIMTGLFQPSYGEVLVDGRSLASMAPEDWRRRIGVVSQDDQLFAGTLVENIAFFDPEIDIGRAVEVAKLASIHDEIEALPMGYDTLVGDMGSALSGGQKQKVLLARALYPNPSVLFIDEGTANLDPASEESVVKAISALPITRIVSAHKPAPVSAADRVLFVSNGSIFAVPKDGVDMHPKKPTALREDSQCVGQ
ncbi:peptidase domain-containing ABC transporter [Sphingosinicella sp. LHD-64]|uniref:peptidase domain-containing ABC transporter n=1 Tax=Sphingosinicella sp. LHD-64 TaxID=3072139 RepID=UPI0028103AC5|nr:peptidase domain-containing ABC transporter [Sphingosinicella sp. LHD-64]MDQ8756910.1 peptidase domain-containing ABC transporter [Sphingosinicella sp. LHD-64]